MCKFNQRLLLLAFMFVPILAMSQVTISQYSMEAGVDASKWIPLPTSAASTQTLITNGGDAHASDVVNIGFDFLFGGDSYSQFSVNTDGNLRLGSVASTTGGFSGPFGGFNLDVNLPKINAMGCDGIMPSDGYVKSAVIGATPNRVLVVEYKVAKYANNASTSDVMWQVHLCESSNDILFVYGSVAPTIAPNNFQIGMASSETEVLTVNTHTNMSEIGPTTVKQTEWPAPNTYYRFYIPSCIRPSGLEISSLTAYAASFNWNHQQGQSTWQYTYTIGDASPNWITNVVTVNDTLGSISGLQPNTDYTLYLRTDCGIDGNSDAVALPFTTGCVSLDYPYSSDFEDYSTGDIPNCWTSHLGTSAIRSASSYSPTANSGIKSLELGSGDIVFAPKVKLAANQMFLSVQIMSEDLDAGSVEIGYATTTNPADFVSLLHVSPLHNVYQEYIVDFSSLSLTDSVYIAFKHNVGENTYFSYFIDDVHIYRSSSCPRVGYAYAENITHNNATIVWQPQEGISSYEVAYGLIDSVQSATKVNVQLDQNSTILTELLSDTTYYVWVRNCCDSDSSMWYAVAPFRTRNSCPVISELNVAYVSQSSASLNWVVDESYGDMVTAVELSYKKQNESTWSAPITVTQNYYILPNLESGYTYEVRMRTYCNTNPTDYATISFAIPACGSALIGDHDGDTPNLPFGGNYNYAFSQMLYPASTVAGLDTIIGVAFDINFAKDVQSRTIDLYIGNVSQSTLTPNTSINMDSLTKVVEDYSLVAAPGWVYVMFDSAFVYDGSSNIAIAVDDHTGTSRKSIYMNYNTYGTSLYRRSDMPIFTDGDTIVTGLSKMSNAIDITFVTKCPVSACVAPTLAIDEITSSIVSLVWQSDPSYSQWIVGYKVADSSDWNIATATSTQYSFNNLLSGTRYDFRVGVVCNGDTLYSEIKAITDCIAFDLPLAESFDDAILPCWTVGSMPGTSTTAKWKENGQKFDFTNNPGAYLISPEVAVNANTLQVSFSVESRSPYYGGALVILVGSDPSNFHSFVPIDTVVVAPDAPMSSQLVSLNSYQGNGRYVMFCSFTGCIYVDDIVIDEVPECSIPINIAVSDIHHNGATLTWNDYGLLIDKWRVAYLKAGESIPTIYEVPVSNGPIHTVTGLQSNTEYSVLIYSLCSNGDTNVSLHPVTFRTTCGPIELPYHEDFEDIVHDEFHLCWYRDEPVLIKNRDIRDDDMKVPAIFIGEGGSNTVALSDNKSIVSPRIPLPLNQVSLNFDMKAYDTSNTGDLVIGFTTDPHNIATMTPLDTLHADTTSWNNYTLNFNQLTTTDTGYIVFQNINNLSTGSGWSQAYYLLWLDNIDFSSYTSCERPQQVTVSNITATAAQINFSDPASINDYTIAWNYTQDRTTATTLNVTTTTAQLTNLLSGTTYYVWVRSNCSGDQHSSWVAVNPFTTECQSLDLPYSEDFNDYTYGVANSYEIPINYPNHALPNCWKIHGLNPVGDEPFATISNYPDYAASGNTLYAASSAYQNLFFVLPKFNAPTDALQIDFTYRINNVHDIYDEFLLGVMTDPNDTTTFIPVQSIPVYAKEFTHFDHAFAMDTNIQSATNYYIAFRYGAPNSYQKLGLDDIVVDYAPSSIRPVELHINQVTTTSAVAHWRGLASQYQVQYRLADADNWSALSANASSASLTNLAIGSKYQVRVRAIGNANDTSAWSDVSEFTTLCSPVAVPWSEDFESYTVDISTSLDRPRNYPHHAMPECWVYCEMNHSTVGGPAVYLTSQSNTATAHYNSIEGISMRLTNDDENPTYVALPAFAANIDSLVLSFEYAMVNYGDPIILGVMTDPHDFSTFTMLETFPVADSAHRATHYFVFDQLDANQDYFIALYASGATSTNVVIDNIEVDYLSGCLVPNNLRPYSVLNSTALIKWNTIAPSTEIRYSFANSNAWTAVTTSNDSLLLSNLISSTEYKLIARSICGVGDTSAWTDTLYFTTECVTYEMPFREDFVNRNSMSDLDCWSFYKGVYDDVMSGTAFIEKVAANKSNWKYENDSEFFTNNHAHLNIYGSDRCDWFVTPIISIDPHAVLSFDMALSDYHADAPAENDPDDRLIILITTNNGATWNKLMSWGSKASDNAPLDSISHIKDSFAFPLDAYSGEEVRIAFYGESTVFGGDNSLYLGDIKVEVPPCQTPANVSVEPLNISATLSWQGSALDYQIQLRDYSSEDWGDTIIVSGFSYTFINLIPETTYQYRLRQACDQGYYSEWVSDIFTTTELLCEAPTINVTDITVEGATFSWSEGENHQAWEINIFNTVINQSIDLTEPRYTATGLEPNIEYSVAVRAKCAEYVYSDWSDTITFTTLDCLPVTDITVSDITATSAHVAWTAGGEESAWQITYGERGFDEDQGIIIDVTTNSYTINNLQSNTAYEVYVRSNCSSTLSSVWSEPKQFQTLAGQEGIDGVEGNFQFTIYPNPTSNATTISLNGVEGKVVISVVDMNGRTVANEAIECGVDCEKRIDVSGLSQGTYFVRVLGDNINSVRKLIVR